MMVNRKMKSYLRNFKLLLAGLVLCISAVFVHSLNAAQQDPNSKDSATDTNRYKVFSLRHISCEQAIDYIKRAGITITSRTLKDNILSTSGQSTELNKAAELLKLVDSTVPFVVERIAMPKQTADSNSNKRLAAKTNGISIGTFSNPPLGEGAKAIVDVSETGILVVAPADKADQIKFSFGASSQTVSEPPVRDQAVQADVKKTVTEPNVIPDDMNTVSIPGSEQIPNVDANMLEGIEINLAINNPSDTKKVIDINTIDINRAAVEALLRGDSKSSTKPEANEIPLSDVFGKLVESLSTPAQKTLTAQQEPDDTDKVSPVKSLTQPPAAEKPTSKTVTERVKTQGQTAEKTANQSLETKPAADDDEILELTLPERMNIIQLIRLVGEYFSLDYMYDPAKVTGEITVSISKERQGRIKVKELYPLLEQALKFKGLVMTRRGNLVTIVPATEAITIDPTLVDTTKRKIEQGDVVVTKVFHLKYIDAESARNLLTGMGMGVDINTSASAAKILIVTEYAYRMGRVEQLLEMIDKPGEKKTFHFRQLKYTMASTLKDKIKSLADQLGTISITIAETAVTTPTSTLRPGVSPVITRPPVPTVRPPTTMPGAAEVPTVYLDVDERTNRILMIGLPEQLSTVEGLIDILDVQQQDLRSMRVYELKYADAADVVNKLGELNIISSTRATTLSRGRTTSTTRYPGTITGAERITTPGAPGTTPMTVPAGGLTAATTEPLAGEPQIIVIETTNSLLVNATAEQHEQITTIIAYLDTEPVEASINYVVYPLENQDPEELVKVLNQLIQETAETRDPTGKIVSTTTAKKTEEDITIIGDKNTFSVIVYASKRNQQWIESLIRQLDKRRPQVLIDLTLVEISKNDKFTLDLDLLTKYPNITQVGSAQFGSLATSTIPDRRFWEARSLKGIGEGFYNDEHIQALLKAVIDKSYGRVLARPKLLVNDNELGSITTQVQTAIVSPVTTVIPGSATTTPTATLSVSTQTYTSQIKLEIKPHISEGNLLRLEVTMNRTDFGELKNYDLTVGENRLVGPIPPDLLSSDVKTIITVPDQKTIILGGLEKLDQRKAGKKVPLLGDIPLLGVFFRSTSNTDNQSRLYLFVKANILRPEKEEVVSDIVRMSNKNRAQFEKYEAEMQNYQDFPALKPRPMEPKKVLEDNGSSDK